MFVGVWGLRFFRRDDIRVEMWRKRILGMRNSISCIIGGIRVFGLFWRLRKMLRGEKIKGVMVCLG